MFSSKKDVGWSVVKSEAISSQRLKQILIGKQWKICGRSGHLSRCECALVLMREQGFAGEGRARSAKPSPDERSLKTKGEKISLLNLVNLMNPCLKYAAGLISFIKEMSHLHCP